MTGNQVVLIVNDRLHADYSQLVQRMAEHPTILDDPTFLALAALVAADLQAMHAVVDLALPAVRPPAPPVPPVPPAAAAQAAA